MHLCKVTEGDINDLKLVSSALCGCRGGRSILVFFKTHLICSRVVLIERVHWPQPTLSTRANAASIVVVKKTDREEVQVERSKLIRQSTF